MKITIIKSTLIITAAFVTAISFGGCSKKEKKVETTAAEQTSVGALFMKSQNNPESNASDTPKEPSTNGLGISDSKYEEIIKKSLVTTGNNQLVKKVLAKMRAGEEVVVAAIGGSVTEGAGPATYTQGYAYQFKDLFIKEYAADKSKVYGKSRIHATARHLSRLRQTF